MANNREENRVEEEGISYTGGDYDPSKVDPGSGEYYAYTGDDYVDASQEPGLRDTETLFEEDPNIPKRTRSTYFRQGKAPERRPKEEILDDINRRLIYDETISADKIQVGVNDGGEVTLNGIVKSYVAWRTLEGVVQEIPGVTRIKNRLRVQPNGARSA